MLKFQFDGHMYQADLQMARMLNRLVLPDGRLLQVMKWGLLDPPVILEMKVVPHRFQDAPPQQIARLKQAVIAEEA